MANIDKETLSAVLQELKDGTKKKGTIADEYGLSGADMATLNKIKHLIHETDMIDMETRETILTTEMVVIDKEDFARLEKKINLLGKMVRSLQRANSSASPDFKQKVRVTRDNGQAKAWIRYGLSDRVLSQLSSNWSLTANGKEYFKAKRFNVAFQDDRLCITIWDFQEAIEIALSEEATLELAQQVNLVTEKAVSLTYFPGTSSFGIIFGERK